MHDDEFEWDRAKARRNYIKHGVTFDSARKAFADPFMVEVLDDSEGYGEERFLIIGFAEGQLLSVIYTPRRVYSTAGALPPDLSAARDER